MTRDMSKPRVATRGTHINDQLRGGSSESVAQGDPPRVAGRLDTYRSRCGKWHRQVKVNRCPGCGHPHLHRAPLPLVRSVLKTAPCGTVYVVQLRTGVVAA